MTKLQQTMQKPVSATVKAPRKAKEKPAAPVVETQAAPAAPVVKQAQARKPAQRTVKPAKAKRIESGLLLSQAAALGKRYLVFLNTGIMYHVRMGRVEATPTGFKCTADGQNWFSAGGRSAKPEDVSRMRVSLTTGVPFLSHKGEETKVEKAPDGSKFPYRIPERNLVAGRIDSQAQFSCLML